MGSKVAGRLGGPFGDKDAFKPRERSDFDIIAVSATGVNAAFGVRRINAARIPSIATGLLLRPSSAQYKSGYQARGMRRLSEGQDGRDR